MAFLEDIAKIFSKELPVQLIGSEGAVINSHSGLKRLSSEEILVCYGKTRMLIRGEDLTVVYATTYEIYVAGKIKGVDFCE